MKDPGKMLKIRTISCICHREVRKEENPVVGEARVGSNGPEHSPGTNVRGMMQYAREGWCFLNWHETKQAII